MKKFVRVTLITAACLLALGLLVGGVGLSWALSTADRLLPEEGVSQSVLIDAQALRRLDLRLALGDVTLLPVPAGGQAQAQISGYTKDELKISQADGVLSIDGQADWLRNGSLLSFGPLRIDMRGRLHVGSMEERRLTLYLPEQQLEAIDIAVDVGDLHAEVPLRAKRIALDVDTGDLTLRGVEGEQMTLSSNLGDLDVEDLRGAALAARTDTGSLTLRRCAVTEGADIQVDIGDLTVEEAELHNAELSSDTGSVRFAGALRGNCSVASDIGEVVLDLNDRAENYSMQLSCGIGQIHVGNADLVLTEGDGRAVNPRLDAPAKVAVRADTGDLRVTFAP